MKFRANCSVEPEENILVSFHKEKGTLLLGINTKSGNFPHVLLSREDTLTFFTLLQQALEE